jgi:hypothetical protein
MADSGAPLKLRIGAMLAMVVLIIAIIALLRECRGNLTGNRDGGPSGSAEKAAAVPSARDGR